MKGKPDNHGQEKRADTKQTAEEAGLPERIKPPSPDLLAQIAAGFWNPEGNPEGIQTRPAAAVKKAVSLYLRTLEFVNKYDNLPVRDLAEACEDHELVSQLTDALMVAPFKRTFLLEPGKPQDEARRELAKSIKNLRKAETVLENLREMHLLIYMRRFLREKKIPVSWKDGKPLLIWGTTTKSEHEACKAKCRMVTRREYDDLTKATARKHGWHEADGEREWKRDLAQITEIPADGQPVYHLRETWLAELIEWKRSLKRTGGIKSRHSAKQSAKSS